MSVEVASRAYSVLGDHSSPPYLSNFYFYKHTHDRNRARAEAVLRQADLHRLIDRLWTFSIMEQPGQVGMCLHVPQNPEGSNLNGDSWCLIPPTELTKGQACATVTPFGDDKESQYRPIDKGDIPRAGTDSLLIYFVTAESTFDLAH